MKDVDAYNDPLKANLKGISEIDKKIPSALFSNNPLLQLRRKNDFEVEEIFIEEEIQNANILLMKNWMLDNIHPSIKFDKSRIILDEKSHMINLVEALLRSHTLYLVCLTFFINHLEYSNLISMVLPLSLFLYALVESPFPSKAYWTFMSRYLFIIILMKMMYQLPLFCGDPSFTLVFSKECKFNEVTANSFYKRFDVMLGIRKFNGPASFPRDEGIFRGLIWDYLALISILVHRACCRGIGLWDNVTLSGDKRLFPQLNKDIKRRKTRGGRRSKMSAFNTSMNPGDNESMSIARSKA